MWHQAKGHLETLCPVPVKLIPELETQFPELGTRFRALAMRYLAPPGSESSTMGCYRPVKPIRTGFLVPNLALRRSRSRNFGTEPMLRRAIVRRKWWP